MRSKLLCGASRGEAPSERYLDGVVLRITEWDVSDAISLSVALKRPDRSFGAIIASSASSFTDGGRVCQVVEKCERVMNRL
jgi:hypothetical protein